MWRIRRVSGGRNLNLNVYMSKNAGTIIDAIWIRMLGQNDGEAAIGIVIRIARFRK
ncbi:MAG: hypothetical protein RR475_05320 [Clostridia bacterium]